MPCFCAPDLSENDEFLILGGEEFHHAVHVVRKQVGETILVTNGCGLLAEVTITAIHKKQIIAKINAFEIKTKSSPQLALAFALLKNKHDYFIIEKATELGVAEFFPFISTRSVRKPSANTVDKFKKISIAASKQCDNAFFPEIHNVAALPQMIEALKQKNYLPIAAYEHEKTVFLNTVFPNHIQTDCCLIIGPEGGFDEAEISFLQAEKIPLISLGNHILRAETAAICGISNLVQKCLTHDKNFY